MRSSPPVAGRGPGQSIAGPRRPSHRIAAATDLAAATALVGVAVVAPWWFGGVQARAQLWLFVGILISVACWFVGRCAIRGVHEPLPLAIIPLLLAAGLALFQLIPLDPGIVAFLSPAAAELRGELLPTEADPESSLSQGLELAPVPPRQPLSLYPASTRRDLALLVFAIAVFTVGATAFAAPRMAPWLCGLTAVNGAALAFFGLVQKLTWNGSLYWAVGVSAGGRPFGPFVNRNNAGGYLNLCLAGAVGLMIYSAARRPSGRCDGPGRAGRNDGRWVSRALGDVMNWIGELDTLTIAAAAAASCILGGIVCTLSRGAGVALVGASMLTAFLVFYFRRPTVRTWAMGLAALAGLGLVSWVGMSDAVQARFATLVDQQTISHTRIPHWRDGVKAAGDFWPLGSGLGTYRYVYRPYQERLSQLWYYHAENQYLEALVEGGILGLSLMLLMIGLVALAAWRLLRSGSDPRVFAFGVTAVFALSSQAIHAVFDFGLYIPANVLLFALLCGAACGQAVRLAKDHCQAGLLALPRAPRLSTLFAGCLLAAVVWGWMETRSVAAVERALSSVRFDEEEAHQISDASLSDAIARLQPVAEHREDDAEAQYRMATLWLHLYRVRAFDALRKDLPETVGDSAVWQATSQIVLHGRAHHLIRNSLPGELENLRHEPVIQDHLAAALRHFVLARQACPLMPEVHVAIGELCFLVTTPAADHVHVERAQRLAPSDPDLLFRCGFLESQAGRRESAAKIWRRCLALDSKYLSEILDLGTQYLGVRQMVEDALPDSPQMLLDLARERYQAKEHAEIRRLLSERAEALLETADLPAEERAYLRGSTHALKQEYAEAIAQYAQAVQLRPRAAGWRYELARLLKEQGRINEAHEQATLCARLDPQNGQYRTLLRQINRARLTAGTTSE